ncbi:small multidrug resistance pump [Kitasatospora gansuensis]|uniref:Small multidrug resistance pump n=1 Tax=Kitasatospora gansuensis TaxID=258050 RepID=A0A7W7WG57_9ACTN|nr:multidrug efflux SMR transporter [Kitasatospora gansuensis]MBB4945089.1 small multidrug resistance pump [Kitasatospora gansuensis]
MTAYLLVGAAIGAEVTATLALRASHGLTRLMPSLVVAVGYIAAFVLLAQALKSLNVGPVYAIWSGLGTVGALIGGVVAFNEPIKPATAAGAVLVVLGVAVMYLGGGLEHE